MRFLDLEEIPADFAYLQSGIRLRDIEDADLRARAEALEPDNERCQQCDQGVGVVLVGDDDRPQWRWVSIAADDKGTWLLCEECSGALFCARPACTFCGRPTAEWPSKDCEEPQRHDRSTYICDCGDVLTVAQATEAGDKHRRCNLIGARS